MNLPVQWASRLGSHGLGWVLVLWTVAWAAWARPNVVMIVADDQGWSDYGFMGHPHIRTPHLDRLARESLLFPRGYVTTSLCCPSLASLLTGKYPHQTKVTGNEPPLPAPAQREGRYQDPGFLAQVQELNGFIQAHPRVPSELGRFGYLSFQSGKWWAGNYTSGGFTHGMSHGEPARGGRHGDQGLKIGRESMQPVFDFVETARSESRPFFLWYAPMLPHQPHDPPDRLLGHYVGLTNSLPVARYWAMCEWFDETCGLLLDYLDERGLGTNTLVCFLADNGWIQDPDRPTFRLDSKQSPYDGGLRTPIMVRWRGRVEPRVDDTPVSSLDLAPTIYRAAGVAIPKGLAGVDLLNRRAVRGRSAVFGACFLHNAVDLNDPARNLTWRWCVAGDWKLILPNPAALDLALQWGKAGGGPELYCLTQDPWEERNLAAKEPRRLAQIQRRLDAWWNPGGSLALKPSIGHSEREGGGVRKLAGQAGRRHGTTVVPMEDRSTQLTSGPGGRVLTNTGVWSADGEWIVYDTRADAAGEVFDGLRIEMVRVTTGEVRVLYEARHGACCGVVTCHPTLPKVVFILGPEHPTPDWRYGPYHRQGVIVEMGRPGVASNLDARDLTPPFTPGALRGGSHVHVWSPEGDWVSYTYEDHVLAQFSEETPEQDINLRNVAVSVPGEPVRVDRGHPRNHDGEYFSAVVTRTTARPQPGSDEIQRACEEGWVGEKGYRRADGGWQKRALAFQGHVVTLRGETISEVFVADLPEDLRNAGAGPLAGTETRRPFPPAGVVQRRLTHTEGRRHPGIQGPRHWLRSAPDGSRIGFLMKDDAGVVQLWTVSPAGGPPVEVTRNPWSVASAFTWSPDGRRVAHVMDGSVCVTEVRTGSTRRVTPRYEAAVAPRPEACVFSPDGRKIAFVRRVPSPMALANQIFVVPVD